MTKEAIEKLDRNVRAALEMYATLITRATDSKRSDRRAEYCFKLKGYLECLIDSGKISDVENRGLYLYYATNNLTF